jgi:RNA polymerase sigma-70 factor (ECF subfamily)
MRDVTVAALQHAGAASAADTADDVAFMMDEDAFRLFYERTARPVWAYLSRITGDARLADDLLQEAYYRFLRSRAQHESDEHRRNYLFRIATNLVHDLRRRPRAEAVRMDEVVEPADPQSIGDEAARVAGRVDLSRALAQLKPRERDLLWLAYAQGSTHHEIAKVLGVRTGSIKPMLFRARRRLAALLGGRRR